ncbi:MAG: hypothetical protein GY798_09220 [Hyphomicrobiales bacterium]|nr:hypothetical protein [Hyphomicrobiales bacterium]
MAQSATLFLLSQSQNDRSWDFPAVLAREPAMSEAPSEADMRANWIAVTIL